MQDELFTADVDETNGQITWADMTPADFGHTVDPVQGALFQAPDGCGTLDLFDA